MCRPLERGCISPHDGFANLFQHLWSLHQANLDDAPQKLAVAIEGIQSGIEIRY